MMRNGSKWLVLGSLLYASTCWCQAEAVPGMVEFPAQEVLGSDVAPNVDVLLEKPMLRVMAAASQNTSGELSTLIEQIDTVQVKVWEDVAGDKPGSHLTAVEAFAKGLKAKHWRTMVKVPEEGELVEVMTLTEGEMILGLLVLVAEEDEMVFVNIAGTIAPEVLGVTLAPVIGKIAQGGFNLEDVGAMLVGGQVEEEEEIVQTEEDDAPVGEATPEEKE